MKNEERIYSKENSIIKNDLQFYLQRSKEEEKNKRKYTAIFLENMS